MRTFTLILSLLFITTANAQTFEKGNHVIDAGIGFGLWGSISTDDDTTSSGDASGAGIYSLRYQYAISNKLGIGAQYGNYNYIEGDSSGVARVFSHAFGAHVGWHLLRGDKSSLEIGITPGYATIKFESNDPNDNAELHGGGFYMQAGLFWRIYFGKHIGIRFGANYANYNYQIKGGTLNGQEWVEPPEGWPKIKLSGGEVETGLVIKI